jgi:hypothetical protein
MRLRRSLLFALFLLPAAARPAPADPAPADLADLGQPDLAAPGRPDLAGLGQPGPLAAVLSEPLPAARKRERIIEEIARLARAGAGAPDWRQREAAIEVLCLLPAPEQALLPLINDAVPAVRLSALLALSRQPVSDAALGPLRRALEGPGPGPVHVRAALLLNRLGDLRGIPVLLRALQAGELPEETALALRALGRDEDAVRLTAGLLADPDTRPEGARAALALRDPFLGTALWRAVPGSPPALRATLAEALAALGPLAPPPARAWLRRHRRPLLASRAPLRPQTQTQVPVPDEGVLFERLLRGDGVAADPVERLRAAAAWLAAVRP